MLNDLCAFIYTYFIAVSDLRKPHYLNQLGDMFYCHYRWAWMEKSATCLELYLWKFMCGIVCVDMCVGNWFVCVELYEGKVMCEIVIVNRLSQWFPLISLF